MARTNDKKLVQMPALGSLSADSLLYAESDGQPFHITAENARAYFAGASGNLRDKGYFPSQAALLAAHPAAGGVGGDNAIVGNPPTLWAWNPATSAWTDTAVPLPAPLLATAAEFLAASASRAASPAHIRDQAAGLVEIEIVAADAPGLPLAASKARLGAFASWVVAQIKALRAAAAGAVRTINGVGPDANGNVSLAGGGSSDPLPLPLSGRGTHPLGGGYPSAGGSGPGGAPAAGDYWFLTGNTALGGSSGGTVGTRQVDSERCLCIALSAGPGQADAAWLLAENMAGLTAAPAPPPPAETFHRAIDLHGAGGTFGGLAYEQHVKWGVQAAGMGNANWSENGNTVTGLSGLADGHDASMYQNWGYAFTGMTVGGVPAGACRVRVYSLWRFAAGPATLTLNGVQRSISPPAADGNYAVATDFPVTVAADGLITFSGDVAVAAFAIFRTT